MSFSDSYSDNLDSDNNFGLSEDEQKIRKKHHLDRSLHKSRFTPQSLQKVHSSGQSWNLNGEPASCDVLNNARNRNLSPRRMTKESGNKAKPFNPSKSLPLEASSQKSNTNSMKARRTTMPNRIYSHQATRYKSVSRVMPSTFGMRPKKGQKQDPPKQSTPYATQRLLSARKLRIDDLRNQIIDLDRQLEDARKEIRFMKKLHDRQQKELKKIEKTRGEIPDMEKSHDEELRIIKAMNRKLQDKIKDLEITVKSKDGGLHKLTNTLQNAKAAIEQSKRAEIEHEKKLKSLNVKLTKKEEKLQALNKQIETIKRDLSTEKHKHEETKTFYVRLQGKMKEENDTDNSDQAVSVVKVDVPNLAATFSATNEKHQSDLLPNVKEFLTSDIAPTNIKGHMGEEEFSTPKKQLDFWSTRKKEFSTSESPRRKEFKKERDSPSPDRHQSHLLSTRKKEISVLKNRSNRESRKQKQSMSLPSTSTRGRSKMDPSFLISSPEIIFSRLQNLRLEDSPLIMSTPSEWHEAELSAFMKESGLHNSNALCLEDCATTKPLPPATMKKRK